MLAFTCSVPKEPRRHLWNLSERNRYNRPYSRHLCTRFRIDGKKAMSRGISGGNQKIKFANAREIAVDFVYSLKTKRRFMVMQDVRFEFPQNKRQYSLLCGYLRLLLHPKKVKLISSTHNLPLSSLIQKVVHFFQE